MEKRVSEDSYSRPQLVWDWLVVVVVVVVYVCPVGETDTNLYVLNGAGMVDPYLSYFHLVVAGKGEWAGEIKSLKFLRNP